MRARLVPAAELDSGERGRMLGLLGRHFAGITRDRFEADLAEKNWALLLEDGEGALVGFSSIHYHPAVHDGETLGIVYSGDTIVDPAAWNASVLAPAWIAAVRLLHRDHPGRRLFWLLITSGFRTYRFLPTFWREFFPRHDRPTPPALAALAARLAGERFGSSYDPATGIVRFAAPQVLRNGLGGIPPSRLDNPHVAFFARANPGHARGDELVCLTDLSDANLTPAGLRMVRRGEASGWFGDGPAAGDGG